MKRTRTAIALAACIAALVAPTLLTAQDLDPATATCAQFAALDAAGMAAAVTAMHAASPDAATVLDEAAQAALVASTTLACEGNPDMLAMDAMQKK